MSCINKNDKGFRYLAYKFGEDAAENIVRSYTRSKNSEEFVFPTVRQALKFIQDNKDSQVENVIANIKQGENTTDNIIRNLKGIVSVHDGAVFITKGWLDEGGTALREEQKKVVFDENYRRMQKLAEEYPSVFEIKDTKYPYTKVVKINGEEKVEVPDLIDLVPVETIEEKIENEFFEQQKKEEDYLAKQEGIEEIESDLGERSKKNSTSIQTELFSSTENSLFGLDTQNQQQLEFHINTLGAINNFLENIGIEQRLVSNFLQQDGSIVEGALAAANFIQGTVDIIDDINKRPSAWNKLPEEAAHWWYRLLDNNSELKDALLTSGLTNRKEKELRNSLYGDIYDGPKVIGKLALDAQGNVIQKPALSPIREEAIGQLIAEAIKRIEDKSASTADYSFFKKFLEWINSIINIFKTTEQDPFEVAAMKILSSDMSDLMTWEEYSKLNNIVNFSDVLTNQSVAPIDYTLIEDLVDYHVSWVEYGDDIVPEFILSVYGDFPNSQRAVIDRVKFTTQEELDSYVINLYGKEYYKRQKAIIQEVRDNQIFFDRLLNKTFRKKSKFLPKTLRKYFDIIDSQNLSSLREWDISQELQQITKKLSEAEKKQIIETNGYTNIAPTLKVLPDLLQKYGRKTTPEIIKQEFEITIKLVKKEITKEQATELRQKLENKKKGNPIVLSEPIKIDGAKKQELSILNGIKDMIKLENPNLKSITAEEFVAEAHNWLQTNYLLGFANETGINGEISSGYPGYNVSSTFIYYDKNKNISETDLAEYRNLTEEEIRNLTPERRQIFLDIAGLGNRQYDIYHNKISISFNDTQHLKYHPPSQLRHFKKFKDGLIPSAWGNLTYFYTGKNKWKDAVLLHEIQNDNIEALREYKSEKVDLETSLGRYLQELNTDLISNIEQIESGGKKLIKHDIFSSNIPKQHTGLNFQLSELQNLPLDQGLRMLKQRINEGIELYKSESSRGNNPKNAEMAVEEAYSKKRKFNNLQSRGGIKSLLTDKDINYLKGLINYLNNPTTTDSNFNTFDDIDYDFNDLSNKKNIFISRTKEITEKINTKLINIYGVDAPMITLNAPGKPRTKTQIRQGIERNQKLNESVDYLLISSERQINKELSRVIEFRKKDYIRARNAEMSYNFNVSLSKINQEQYNNLIENYKYNQDLLKRLIDEQAQKDIKQSSNLQLQKENDLKTITQINPSRKDTPGIKNWIYKINDNIFKTVTKQEAIEDIEIYYSKDKKVAKQNKEFENLKQKALEKKEELDKNYGKIEEEVKQTLEIEMNYFTPLVHHLIQKHINQYGKDFPMYFSGYNITILTQNNERTALIYAGKDEVNTVDKLSFDLGNDRFSYTTLNTLDYRKNGNIISQQEYEKAYQKATERRAKEIKFEAAKQIGFLLNEHNGTKISDLTEKELDEGIKGLNEYKKISKQNMDRVINTIMNISNSKPIETGAIYNAMSQISGVKLIWQDKIEGLKNNAGGYLVDLSGYNYSTPILYGLESKQKQAKEENSSNEELTDDIKEFLSTFEDNFPLFSNLTLPERIEFFKSIDKDEIDVNCKL